MFKSNIIKIDFDILDETIKNYDTNIQTLNKAKVNIKSGLSKLEESWTGKGKEAYFTVKYANWDKGLIEHISRMEFLKKQLILVKKSYEDIMKEGNNLKNKI